MRVYLDDDMDDDDIALLIFLCEVCDTTASCIKRGIRRIEALSNWAMSSVEQQ
jgi:hypothetical protein